MTRLVLLGKIRIGPMLPHQTSHVIDFKQYKITGKAIEKKAKKIKGRERLAFNSTLPILGFLLLYGTNLNYACLAHNNST